MRKRTIGFLLGILFAFLSGYFYLLYESAMAGMFLVFAYLSIVAFVIY